MTDQACITAFERGLNELARRRESGTNDNDELVRFAAHLNRAARPDLSLKKRHDIWSAVMSSPATTAFPQTDPDPLSRPTLHAPTHRRIPGSSGSPAFLPRGVPAPAVLFFGVMIALIVTLAGIGNDGDDMVTPTAHAEHAATAIASPATSQPTSTIAIVEMER